MPAPNLILHHYEASPYAEKIRLMFGRAQMPWQSLLSPVQPPRPNLDPLTGGYRRIPVLQLGADIYCDSTLIAQRLAAISGCQALAPALRPDQSARLAERAEREVFFAGIGATPPLRLLRTLLGGFGPLGTLRFVRDRAAMMKNATVRAPQGQQAKAILDQFCADLDAALANTDFLDGREPGYNDFCCYHPLWLAAYASKSPPPKRFVRLTAWYSAVGAVGHGQRREIKQADAFAQAHDAEPLETGHSLEDALLGKQVAIAPADYGREAVIGELVCVTPLSATLARDTPAFGRLHVHFPRAHYVITAA